MAQVALAARHQVWLENMAAQVERTELLNTSRSHVVQNSGLCGGEG